MPDTIGHTASDHAALIGAGIDPDTVQPREHGVPCQRCRRNTLNIAATCDTCRTDRPSTYEQATCQRCGAVARLTRAGWRHGWPAFGHDGHCTGTGYFPVVIPCVDQTNPGAR